MINHFNNLKIRTKLLFAFTVIIILTVIIGASNINALVTAQRNFTELEEHTVAKMVVFASFREGMNTAIIAAYEYIQIGDPAARNSSRTMLASAKKAKENLTALTVHSKKEQALAGKLDDVFGEITQEITLLFDIYDGGGPEEAQDAQVKRVQEAQGRAAEAAYEEIDTFLASELTRSDMENRRFLTLAIEASIVLTTLIFFMGITFALAISHLISKPIRKLRDTAEEIARGKIYKAVEEKNTDEIGQLATSFNKMIVRLRMSHENLEQEVIEKTSDLTRTLKQLKKEKDRVFHEKEKIDSILYSIGDGVFVVDRNYKITMFNRIAADMSGFSVKEAIGKKYSEILQFVYEKDGKANDTFIKNAMTTGEIGEMTNHTVLVQRDGGEIAVSDSAAPLQDEQGNIIGCVVVFRDITKEREIDRAKSEFVSLAAHQLKTPITSIKWSLDMVLSGRAGKILLKQKEYLKSSYKSNERLIKLVDAFLNVSRIELGTLAIRPEPLNLKEVANSVLDELEARRKKKELQITKHYDKNLPLINVDRQLISIIFENLFSNAIKYTPESGKIDIRITKEKSGILIAVSDTGYGIPKNQQSRVFSKLFRADNIRDKDTDGTGLGLYIVKSILEKSGGRIWFESEENKGTTFYVAIPISGMKEKEGTKSLA